MNKTLPELASYSSREIEAARASWPAIDRYVGLLERSRTNPSLDSNDWVRQKIKRHEAWLRSSLALFHARASDDDICFFWSQNADANIKAAAIFSGLDQTGAAVFALGKLGAEELNLSSDIDLVILIPDGIETPISQAREFIRLLAENDEWGFCHRVDLALRPGGTSATLVPNLSQFINHYGYQGEAWERLAYVRFRHITGGASDFLAEVQDFAKKFSYRRHLDYSVFEELRLLIHRIRSENPQTKSNEFHLKLHPGGIRDIELFTHALQTIHGGRRKELQTHRTETAILRLSEAGLITNDEAKTLIDAYWFYRNIENKIQAEDDAQTYRAPHDLVPEIRKIAAQVIAISDAGFPDVKSAEIPTAQDLAHRGFNLKIAEDALIDLKEARVLSKKSERDEREKNLFFTAFIDALERSGGDLDLGLGLLVDFVKNSRAKATLFSLLNREPVLINQLATLFGISPWAGMTLCSRPELLDSLILRQTTDLTSLDMDQALEALAERRLLGELIATLHFLESKDLETCVQNLTSLADDIATDLMLITAKELGCQPLGIVALGKWGGRELGIRSDLDFVFLTDQPATADEQRLARRFLNRITEAHRGGSIYSVDLRLRPSGHAGPILVECDQLNDHLATKAEAWERQSWLRARSLSKLPAKLDATTRATLLSRGLTKSEETALADIASKLFKGIPTFDGSSSTKKSIDLKLTKGGLAPIEFAAQIGILRSGPNPNLLETSTHGMIHFLEGLRATPFENWSALGPDLRETHVWLRRIEQWIRVTGDTAGSNLNLGSNEFRRLVKTSGESPNTFQEQLVSKLEKSSASIAVLLGRTE